jgi:spore germination cell wall hydrolase CwlJ-like protein
MAARWIGLSRPDPLVRTFALRRARKPFLSSFLHTLGIGSVFVISLAFNCALFPQAYAQARDGMHAPLDFFFAPSQSQAAAPGANPQAAELAALDPAEVHLLAATAWAEARSEGELGMRAVAHVMVNRIGGRFGDDLQTVILAPKQFSAWNLGDPNRPLAQNPEHYATAGLDKATWDTAQEVAREVLSGQSVDPTGGALFYHTRAVHPVWDRDGKGRMIIGAHVFFHDVPDGERIRPAPVRMTRASATSSHRGPRAGRVNGVIQYAPASMAHQLLPGEQAGELSAPAGPATTSTPTPATPLGPSASVT